jgi:hypothetical protein
LAFFGIILRLKNKNKTMILFNRNQNENFLFPERLIFEDVTDEVRDDFEKAKGEEFPERARELEQERKKAGLQVAVDARQEQLDLKDEIDETGPASAYFDTLVNSPSFDQMVVSMESGIETFGTDCKYNFENWAKQVDTEPEELAELFDKALYIPGKGRTALVKGLRIGKPKDSEDKSDEAKQFNESRTTVLSIVKYMREYFDKRRKTTIDTQAQLDKSPLGQTLGDGVKTLMANFERGSGKDKAIMLGALGIGIYLLYKYKDKQILPFWKGSTLGTMASWTAALYAINYLSGKVSKDGRTLLQRVDIARDIDDLSKDNFSKSFAAEHGMDKDQEKLRAYAQIQTMSVKELYRLYDEASSPTHTQKEIDPKALGLPQGSVSGASIYQIIEDLVNVTSENDFKAKHGRMPTGDELTSCHQVEKAKEIFKRKYIYENSTLGKTNQSVLKAVMNEYRLRDTEAIMMQYERGRLPNRVYDKTKEITHDVIKGAEKYGPIVGGYIWGKTKDAWKVTRDYVVDPAGDWVKAKFNQLKPHITKPIETVVNRMQAGAIEKVLPLEFALIVTAPDTKAGKAGSPGQATIMGYPGLSFVKETRTDGKETITIEGNEFVLADGITGNAATAAKLETFIKGEVDALIVAKSVPALKGLNPEWDKAEKKWVIKGVPVNGVPALGAIAPGGTETISFNVNADGKDVKFFLGSQEITDFAELDLSYRNAQIEKKLWDTYPVIKDLPVTIEKDIKTNAALNSVVIKGKIAGLEFMALPNATGSLDFYDGTKQGGMNVIKIKEDNGGDEFLRGFTAKVFEDPTFQNPFVHLEASIDNTNDSVLDRVKLAFATTRLWIFPTNVPEAINGRVLKQQWKYMLDYKRMENLDRFRYQMQDRPLSDLEQVKKDFITDNLLSMENLARDIDAIRDDQKRADEFPKFMDRLETINYTNHDYIKLFKEYKAMITDSRYNYEGVETFKEVPLAGTKAFETYQVLLHVWNYLTDQFSVGANISAADQKAIQLGVIGKIKTHLEAAQQSGGVIKLDELPPHEPEEEISKWVDPSWALQPGKKKAKP